MVDVDGGVGLVALDLQVHAAAEGALGDEGDAVRRAPRPRAARPRQHLYIPGLA